LTPPATTGSTGGIGGLANEIKVLRERLREGGGPDRIDAQHEAGKLTARERVGLLLDPGEPSVELGLLVAHDRGPRESPAAGVVTVVGRVHGREVVVVASDATVDEGIWWPATVAKILRAQEVAMRCRIPIVYLVDSGGLHPSVTADAFPGKAGAGRVLYHAAVMRRYLRTPQLAAVLGPCVGSASYLPALADVIVMVEGTSFLGLGGPDLVSGATGEAPDAEDLGGAVAQTRISGVAHLRAESEPACVERLRELIQGLPEEGAQPDRVPTPPLRLPYELYDLLPDDHRHAYDMRAVLACILDGDPLEEFQPDYAPEMICATGYLGGVRIGIIANARGMFGSRADGAPRLGGILYPESARKTGYFIETMNRHGFPLLFVQDTAGFMIGPEVEHGGIVRAGAELLEAMATATVPKIVLTVNHASGAGYHAMAGQGFDPDFVLSLPTARFGPGEYATSRDGTPEPHVDALSAAARGFVDEIVLPEEVRPVLGLVLRAALRNPGPHVGSFQLG